MRHQLLLFISLAYLLLGVFPTGKAQTIRPDSVQLDVSIDTLSSENIEGLTRRGFELLLKDTDSALAYFHVALKGAKKLADPQLINSAAYWLANAYMIRGEDTEAFFYAQLALSESEKAGDSVRVARSYSVLGLASQSIQDLEKALEFHKKALAFYRAEGNLKKMGTELNNIGLILKEQGAWDEAEQIFEEGLVLKTQAEDARGIAYVKGNLAAMAYKRKRYTEAERLCEELIQDAQGPRTRDILGEALGLRADIALALGQLSVAKEYIEQAVVLANDLKASELRLGLLETQYRYHEARGELDKALAFLAQAYALADTLSDAANRELITSLSLQRERREKALLEKEVELAHTRSEAANIRQQWTLIAALSLLLGAGVIILLVYRTQQRERKNRLQIESQAGQLRMLNHEIREASVQLANHSRVKDKILSLIAHDLRGPLASLGELLDMLHEGRLPEAQFLELTRTLRTRMAGTGPMLENLLEWASYQVKSYEPQLQQTDLTQLVLNSLSLYESVARAKNVSLSVVDIKPLMAFVDPEMTKLALRNLISNAIKFTPVGGQIRVYGSYLDSRALISVSDNGVGMTPLQQERLFGEKHFSTEGTNNEHGAGLGLLLVRDFVEQNRGSIKVESSPGKGSTFTLGFPMYGDPE